jgi:hypothetical protein
MPATYEPIASVAVGSATATITFSSISSAYTDLRVVFFNTSTSGNQNASLTLNGDTGSNYSFTRIKGSGGTASSSANTSADRIDMTADGTSSTIPQLFIMDIFSYGGSTNKTILIESAEDKNGSGSVSRQVALYRSTSAITSLTLTCNTSTWKAGTRATVFGIKAA